ncbi:MULTISPECIES: hypothetical protein [unclassified Methanoregula]|nr:MULTISPECIES: hypothetical protein [unclassified Methanoregula]OPX62264.1 MAG: hypothetical protein A4E33_02333 [Methanoregula sp. PtaB.Bin085]OPY32691.1 MAG: hypothetical protein A4E34_02067 [Methanoregula sp. PtaU1.Bin006]
MSLTKTLEHLAETAGYYVGYCIGFAIIFAIGLMILWVTMEPYH